MVIVLNLRLSSKATLIEMYDDFVPLDYDAPLSEAGDYTPKYFAAKEIIEKFLPIQTLLPKLPAESVKRAFPKALITSYLTLEDLLDQVVIQFKYVI